MPDPSTHFQNEIQFLDTLSEEQLETRLGLMLDQHAAELTSAGVPASEVLYGGSEPPADRPGFLRRLGQNFVDRMNRQFYSLICDPADPDNGTVKSLIAGGTGHLAYGLAILIAGTFGFGWGIAAVVGTLLAKRLAKGGHEAVCKTWKESIEGAKKA